MLLRCGGCRQVVSGWALRCPLCGRDTAGAEELAASLADAVAVAGGLGLGAAPAAVPPTDGPVAPGRSSFPAAGPVTAFAVAAAVLALAVGASVALVGLRSSPGVAAPPGRVLSWTATGQLVSTAADGTRPRALPQLLGTGLVPSPDDRFLATGNGVELSAGTGRLSPTGASVPFDGPPGSWRAVGFADRDQAVAGTETALGGGTEAEVVTLDGGRSVALGPAQEVAPDPGALGVYAMLDQGGNGPSIERRDAGAAPLVVATAAGLLADLRRFRPAGAHPSAADVVVAFTPDPTGARLAVTVVGAGIVVIDRRGGLVDALPVGGGAPGSPAWSPDGSSLVYGTTTDPSAGDGRGAGRAAVALWRPRRPVEVTAAPRGVTGSLGDCLWLGPTAYLCAGAGDPGATVPWVIGRPGGALTAARGPQLPFAWLTGTA